MTIKNNKKKTALAFLLLVSMSFSSCTLADRLGFDTYDYTSEQVIESYSADSDAAALCENLLDLLVSDTVTLSEFRNMKTAVESYREVVLRHMLLTEYAKYSGNAEMIKKASKYYPEYHITQLIPASDFESTMYEYFGGDYKISHKSTGVFVYLKKVNAYICTVTPPDEKVEIEMLGVDETDKTYIAKFRCKNEDETSEVYTALIIKREDGTYYFKQLYS